MSNKTAIAVLCAAFFIALVALSAGFYFNLVRPSFLLARLHLSKKPAPSVSKQPVPASPIRWGAYVGWQKTDLAYFESRVGKIVNIQALFVHWGNENEFPQTLAAPLALANKTLVIFWEATDYNLTSANQPRFNYDAIVKGNWNSYIKSFAQSVKNYGQPVILIPFEEMNGDWYPWSGTKNSNSPQKHIAAYRHIHDLFSGVPNVKFGWTINSNSVPDTPANRLENYYPGDEYVDIVGANGFNFNDPWLTFGQIFNNALARLKVFNKPIYIFSMACANGPKKAGWIADALTSQIPKHPEIIGWIWFNENKEKDWRVWSDAAALAAFKAALP